MMAIMLIMSYMVSSFVVIALTRKVELANKSPYTVVLVFKAFSVLDAAQIFVYVVTNTTN